MIAGTLRELSRRPGCEVEEEDLVPDLVDEADAVLLVVDPVNHTDRSRRIRIAWGLVRVGGVDRLDIGKRPAVRGERQAGRCGGVTDEDARLAAIEGEQGDAEGLVAVAFRDE